MQRTTERVGELERQVVITKDQKKKVFFFFDTATQGWGGDAHRKRNLLFPKSTGFRSIRQCHLKVKYSTMYSATVPRAPAVAGYTNPRTAGCGDSLLALVQYRDKHSVPATRSDRQSATFSHIRQVSSSSFSHRPGCFEQSVLNSAMRKGPNGDGFFPVHTACAVTVTIRQLELALKLAVI